MIEERIVNAFYEVFGVFVPKMHILRPEEIPEELKALKEVLISEATFIKGTSLSEVKNNQEIMDKVRKGFAADAVLGVWDIIKDFKNIMVTPEGEPVRFDMGGGLCYRALGEHKEDLDLLFVKDFDTMRDKAINASGFEA